ncbi:MAG TPA: class I SAM-dependent methyltransferase [Acidimicrobiales bacterium]|nr:class I SAM-dependent methyltransferase [Acidimicrobiales bacterium]
MGPHDTSDSAERAAREQEFHDHAFTHETRARVAKYYAVTRRSSACYERFLDAIAPPARVLEYGCGEGSAAFDLARRGVAVTGIDISPIGIDHANQEAAAAGLSTAEFVVMDAENLTFADGDFDVVCGSGILHHLDLERALDEVARVLSPHGHACFQEPLGHNPLINLYRRLTPSLRTVDEHPLLQSDLARLRAPFGDVEVRYFHLFTLLAVPFRRFRLFSGLLHLLESVDRFLFAVIPPLRRFAWLVVIELAAPTTRSADAADAADAS